MGEGMADLDRGGAPVGGQRRRIFRRSFRPIASGQAAHPAQQAGFGAVLEQHGAVGTASQIGDAQAHRLGRLGRLSRQLRRAAGEPAGAGRAPGAQAAGGVARRADRGAQIHDGLGIVAGARIRRAAGGSGAQFGLGIGERRADVVQPGHDALDIAVDHGGGLVEGDGGNGGGGIRAYAGQALQRRGVIGENAAMRFGHFAGAFQQVARAGVVAEAGPGGHHLGILGGRQRLDPGPAAGEIEEIGDDGGDGGLLQHDLAEPDPVRVGPIAAAWGHAPGQHAGVAVVPIQNFAGGVVHAGVILFSAGPGLAQGGETVNVAPDRRRHMRARYGQNAAR